MQFNVQLEFLKNILSLFIIGISNNLIHKYKFTFDIYYYFTIKYFQKVWLDLANGALDCTIWFSKYCFSFFPRTWFFRWLEKRKLHVGSLTENNIFESWLTFQDFRFWRYLLHRKIKNSLHYVRAKMASYRIQSVCKFIKFLKYSLIDFHLLQWGFLNQKGAKNVII